MFRYPMANSRDIELGHLGPPGNMADAREPVPYVYSECQDVEAQRLTYDKGRGTRMVALILLIIAFLLFATFTGVSGFLPVHNGTLVWTTALAPGSALRLGVAFQTDTEFAAKGLSLAFFLVMWIMTSNLNFIHGVSLRWAKAEEHKLEYNHILRVFNPSKISITNGITANVLWAICLFLCYGGAATAFYQETIITSDITKVHIVYIDAVSLGACGLSGLILSIIAAAGWWTGERSGRIKTWNSHPLNTALACKEENIITRFAPHDNPFHTSLRRDFKYKLLTRQPSARDTIPSLNYVA